VCENYLDQSATLPMHVLNHHHHHHHHHADIYKAPITTKKEHRCSTKIQISDISLCYETRTYHTRLGSKIEAKFRTV